MNPNIALIHAVHAAISPVEVAFAEKWPEATTYSLLAEDLTRDLAAAGKQTDAIKNRISQLAQFAAEANVDGILYTCSAFGSSIEAARENIKLPILKPNEAMFEEAINNGGRVGMLVTFEAAIPSMADEFSQMAKQLHKKVSLETHFVPGALDAINAGQVEKQNSILANATQKLPSYDTLMLAQFSMSGAASDVQNVTEAKVLTSPNSAIDKLKKLIKT